LQAEDSALQRSGRPGRGDLRAHVRVRAGVGASHGPHQRRAAVLVGPAAATEHQGVLVVVVVVGGRGVPARVAANRWAVRVREAGRRVGAAGGERRGTVGTGLRPSSVVVSVVALQAVGLVVVGRVAGRLQVWQGGHHRRNPGGGHVDRRAGGGWVDVVPVTVVSVRRRAGGQRQALVHDGDSSVALTDRCPSPLKRERCLRGRMLSMLFGCNLVLLSFKRKEKNVNESLI